jgi:hypothetical protein
MNKELEALGERIAEQAAHLDAATHRLLTDIRRFDEDQGWYAQGAQSCAHWLSWRVGWCPGTAREHVRVANCLGRLPLIDDALRRGELSYSKVRAITRVATTENEPILLEDARLTTGAQLEMICRKYAVVLRQAETKRPEDEQRRYVSRRDLEDGMVRIEASLFPDEAAIVWAAIERVAKQQCAAQAATLMPSQEPTASNTADDSDAGDLDHDDVSEETPSNTVAKTSHRPRFDRAGALISIMQDVVRGTAPQRSPIELVVSVTAEALRRDRNVRPMPWVIAPMALASQITPSVG